MRIYYLKSDMYVYSLFTFCPCLLTNGYFTKQGSCLFLHYKLVLTSTLGTVSPPINIYWRNKWVKLCTQAQLFSHTSVLSSSLLFWTEWEQNISVFIFCNRGGRKEKHWKIHGWREVRLTSGLWGKALRLCMARKHSLEKHFSMPLVMQN